MSSAAPCSAAGAKRCPSSNSPRLATNTPPGPTSRESVVTGPSTIVARWRPCRLDAAAASPRRSREGQRDHASHPASRSASRASSRAEYGMLHARDLVVVLVARAGVEDRVALAREGERRAERGTRIGDLVDLAVGHRGAAPAMRRRADRRRVLAARVEVGDDDDVAARAAIAPISARFVVSRSPSAPKTMITRPSWCAGSRRGSAGTRRGCGRSRCRRPARGRRRCARRGRGCRRRCRRRLERVRDLVEVVARLDEHHDRERAFAAMYRPSSGTRVSRRPPVGPSSPNAVCVGLLEHREAPVGVDGGLGRERGHGDARLGDEPRAPLRSRR